MRRPELIVNVLEVIGRSAGSNLEMGSTTSARSAGTTIWGAPLYDSAPTSMALFAFVMGTAILTRLIIVQIIRVLYHHPRLATSESGGGTCPPVPIGAGTTGYCPEPDVVGTHRPTHHTQKPTATDLMQQSANQTKRNVNAGKGRLHFVLSTVLVCLIREVSGLHGC